MNNGDENEMLIPKNVVIALVQDHELYQVLTIDGYICYEFR